MDVMTDMMIYVLVGIIGLCVGSFLTVVIHRVPLMMMREWQLETDDFIQASELDTATKVRVHHALTPSQPPLNLALPRSHCPHCHTTIAWYDNLPVLSYLLCRGRCRHCHHRIAWQYPATELVTAILSILTVAVLGMGIDGVLGLIFVYFLITLSMIDYQTQLLPDRLVLPLGMIGLFANTWQVFCTPTDAIYGAIAGFVSLWSVNALYRILRGHDGMGLGDAKLLAAIGAWLGIWALPLVLLIGAGLGVIAGLCQQRTDGKAVAFAFGPYLAMGGVIGLLFGQAILTKYLSLF